MKALLSVFALLFTVSVALAGNNGGPQGGGPGNSGPGDKHSCVEGPPDGFDPCF